MSSALIYAPGFYAKTDELVELAKVASEHGGMTISHMRSEGNQLPQAVDELVTIAREGNLRAEIYHLKAAGEANWPKLDDVIARVEAARAEGLEITADMTPTRPARWARRRDAAVGAGGRLPGMGDAAQGPVDSGAGAEGDADAH
ncbi:MAG: hypothetical protein R2712_05980 [Vicinamibacterales bacterium]